MISQIFWLIVSHFALDFPLQGEVVAKEKDPNSTSPLQKMIPWFWWLTAHALMHGGGVTLATQNIYFGIMETIFHWFIDYGKVNKYYSFTIDQILHLSCKLYYILILWISIQSN